METLLRTLTACGGIALIVGLAYFLRRGLRGRVPLTADEKYEASQW